MKPITMMEALIAEAENYPLTEGERKRLSMLAIESAIDQLEENNYRVAFALINEAIGHCAAILAARKLAEESK